MVLRLSLEKQDYAFKEQVNEPEPNTRIFYDKLEIKRIFFWYCTFFLTTLFFGLLDGLNVDGVELDTRTVWLYISNTKYINQEIIYMLIIWTKKHKWHLKLYIYTTLFFWD